MQHFFAQLLVSLLKSGLGPAVCIIALFVSACGACFFIGSRLRKVSFESQGHKAIEDHLVRQADQLARINKKYEDLRKKFGTDNDPDST